MKSIKPPKNAEVAHDTDELPVYIVTGVNWTCEVPLDEYNAQFDKETQIHEAATRAIEALEKLREDVQIVLNPESRGESTKLGVQVLVHLKNTNPEHASVIFTHICFGNTGLYKKAFSMKIALDKQVAELRQRRKELAKRDKQLAREAGALKALFKPKKKKKNRDYLN